MKNDSQVARGYGIVPKFTHQVHQGVVEYLRVQVKVGR